MWPRRILTPLLMLTALLGGAFSAAAPALAAGTPPSVGWVRVANLSAGSPAVDIYLLPFGNSANPVVLRHETYGDVSGYMSVSSGQYTVAMRPVGASASSPPILSTNFMVSPGTNYTVASLGPAAGRRLEVLKDQMATSDGSTLVRVIQASLKQDQVTVSVGQDVLAQQLSFGKVTSYMNVHPGQQTVQFTTASQKADMPVTLATGSVHTVVVLDGSSGLKVDALTDAAGSTKTPSGGAATGLGGTAPRVPAGSAQWLATLGGGVALIGAGIVGLRRSRRTAVAARD